MEEKKIGIIKEELKNTPDEALKDFIAAYENDERAGVIKIVEQAKKRMTKLEQEKQRIWNLEPLNVNTNSLVTYAGLMRLDEDLWRDLWLQVL